MVKEVVLIDCFLLPSHVFYLFFHVGVTSAIYGVAFSLIVCVIAVALFTAHITILLIAFLTIAGEYSHC